MAYISKFPWHGEENFPSTQSASRSEFKYSTYRIRGRSNNQPSLPMLKVKAVTNWEMRQDEPQELIHAPTRKPALINPAFQIITYSTKRMATLN